MMRIIYIDVCARSWVRSFCFFIARSIISWCESWMNSLFSDNFIFNVIFLLFVIVSSWTRVFCVCLSSVRGFTFVLPEFTSMSLCQKWLRLLTNELSISWLFQMFISCPLYRNCCCIISGTRVSILNWFLFTIWNFWLENCIHTGRVMKLLSLFFKVVNTRSWIIGPRLIIVCHVSLLK